MIIINRRLIKFIVLACFFLVVFQVFLYLGLGNFNDEYMVSEKRIHAKRNILNQTIKEKQKASPQQAKCSNYNKETLSAFNRATSIECKNTILNVACLHQHNLLYDHTLSRTYTPEGENSKGRSLGCYRDSKKQRLLKDYSTRFHSNNSPSTCINHCLRLGFKLAGVEYGNECYCGDVDPKETVLLPVESCNHQCSGLTSNLTAPLYCGGFFAIEVFLTGYVKLLDTPSYEAYPFESNNHNNYYFTSSKHNTVSSKHEIKVLFMLTLSSRAYRQVARLFKSLYRPHHYYILHVDKRQEYLHNKLMSQLGSLPNVMVMQDRYSTIWGGTSLLHMLLSGMQVAVESFGDWDYFINLSESDYPVKSIEELEYFLWKNNGKNFLKCHGRKTSRFIQRQGLDMLFYECDNHNWRLGPRAMQEGIVVDGGSDWIGLHRVYVSFLVDTIKKGLYDDEGNLVKQLHHYWTYALLPAESFFHTVLQNTRFYSTKVNSNLHLTNWKRKFGCHCQYKKVVDWCGCSPNDFLPSDAPKLLKTKESGIFFARKFEGVINNNIINIVDQKLLNIKSQDLPSINSFWLSVWDNEYNRQFIKEKNQREKIENAEIESTNPKNDLFYTYLTSLVRKFKEGCYINQPIKIIEAFIYKEHDEFRGVVITLNLQKNITNIVNNANYSDVVEVLFSYKKDSEVPVPTRLIESGIKSIQIGTEYDPKEFTFRNFNHLYGPGSEITLVFHTEEIPKSFAVLISVTDPHNSTRYMEATIKKQQMSTIVTDLPIDTPLKPGVWVIKVRLPSDGKRKKEGGEWERRFSVLPITHIGGMMTDKDSMTQVDELTWKHWRCEESCAESVVNHFCRINSMCSRAKWSSLYPDPKSDLDALHALFTKKYNDLKGHFLNKK